MTFRDKDSAKLSDEGLDLVYIGNTVGDGGLSSPWFGALLNNSTIRKQLEVSLSEFAMLVILFGVHR